MQGLAVIVPPILKVLIQIRQAHAPHASFESRIDAQIHDLQPFGAVGRQLLECEVKLRRWLPLTFSNYSGNYFVWLKVIPHNDGSALVPLCPWHDNQL